MNTNLDKLFDKVDEKTASAFADVLLPVRPDAGEKKKVESRVLSAAGGKKRRALRPWHAVIAACLVVAVTLGAVFAPSIFGNGRQRVLEGGNFYNPDGKIVDNINSEGLTVSFEKSLAELLALKHQADGSIYPNGAIFKAKLAEGGSFNIYWYIEKINLWRSSAMLTPVEVTEVFESGEEANLKVGDIVYVLEPYIFINEKVMNIISRRSYYDSYKYGDYISSGSRNTTLIKPEREYIIFGSKKTLTDYLWNGNSASITNSAEDVPEGISTFFSYESKLIFDTTERPSGFHYEKGFISCYDEVIAKYCG